MGLALIHSCEINFNTDNTVIVSGECTFTRKPYSVTVPADGFKEWLNGKHIQDAMPSVSADDREFLISGISPEGWTEAFGNDDDSPDSDDSGD